MQRVFCFSLGLVLAFFVVPKAYARQGSVNVDVKVDGPMATVSGLVSPNALITATSKGVMLGQTTADQDSNFIFKELGLFKNAEELCFDVVDLMQYGKSLSCLTFAPVATNQTFKDVFLPPSISLERKNLNPGEDAKLRGYSVASAQVEVSVKGAKSFSVQAASDGFWNATFPQAPKGKYSFSAKATLNGKTSLEPKYSVELDVSEDNAVVEKREAGKDSLFSPIVLVVLFILAAIPGLLFAFGKTQKGQEYYRRVGSTKLFMKIKEIISNLKHKTKNEPSQKPKTNNS